MDEIAVADTGTTEHYLTLDFPWNNKQLAISPLPIHMPIGEIITSTITALFSKKEVQIEARKAHLFPWINKALLSMGTFFDHGCQTIFYDNTELIINKGSGKLIMKGKRDPGSNMYMLNLTQWNKLMTEFPTPDKYFAGSLYEWKFKSTLADYHHTSCWSSTQSGWVVEITKSSSLLGQAYHLTLCRNI